MKSIWSEDNGGTVLPRVTEKMIVEAEKHFGVALPSAYIEQVNIQNGGWITANAVPSPSKEIQETFLGIDEIFGIGEDGGILDSDKLINEWELPRGIVLFGGTGHTWFGFDYRQTKVEPPVVYVESYVETVEYRLADNFQAFLSMLYVDGGEE
ncbi:SMI1/KNR4 family protein [Alkalihalobacillus sp. LMS6]|uniref:SMI1/KNR4 family protein n=1 Tax=Alkalihalobacillus sp. LMS6 TaxID=2924034 RepID=UPI0020D0B99D|nr:SMI1/KNR4 family protein [Alkalihalobacillus sp. LMS6]UTR05973.1 SMI1/KNR4 family protein [Alkalihalobacillus sp. LMS6]